MTEKLNRILCKYFDEGDKGYVTIGDFIGQIILYIIYLICGISLLHVIYRGIYFILYLVGYDDSYPQVTPTSSQLNDLYSFEGFIGSIIIFISILLLVVVIIIYTSEIKIAKCELKDTAEKKDRKDE